MFFYVCIALNKNLLMYKFLNTQKENFLKEYVS